MGTNGTIAASGGITLDGAEAARVTELLQMLGELPSTPDFVAGEARARARALAGATPVPAHHLGPGARPPAGPVPLDRLNTTGIAGLLELAAGMPSTPPDVADDALAHADLLWGLLSRG